MPTRYRWTMVVILTLLLSACQSAIYTLDDGTFERLVPQLNAPQNVGNSKDVAARSENAEAAPVKAANAATVKTPTKDVADVIVAAAESANAVVFKASGIDGVNDSSSSVSRSTNTTATPSALGGRPSATRGTRVLTPLLTTEDFRSARRNSIGANNQLRQTATSPTVSAERTAPMNSQAVVAAMPEQSASPTDEASSELPPIVTRASLAKQASTASRVARIAPPATTKQATPEPSETLTEPVTTLQHLLRDSADSSAVEIPVDRRRARPVDEARGVAPLALGGGAWDDVTAAASTVAAESDSQLASASASETESVATAELAPVIGTVRPETRELAESFRRDSILKDSEVELTPTVIAGSSNATMANRVATVGGDEAMPLSSSASLAQVRPAQPMSRQRNPIFDPPTVEPSAHEQSLDELGLSGDLARPLPPSSGVVQESTAGVEGRSVLRGTSNAVPSIPSLPAASPAIDSVPGYRTSTYSPGYARESQAPSYPMPSGGNYNGGNYSDGSYIGDSYVEGIYLDGTSLENGYAPIVSSDSVQSYEGSALPYSGESWTGSEQYSAGDGSIADRSECEACTAGAPCRRHGGRLLRALTPRRFGAAIGNIPGVPCAPMTVPTVAPSYPVENLPNRPMSELYPDEYLCDGGDDLYDVQVNRDWSVRGLDPQDTVGHYDTLDGRVLVEASNRVCIYAPRFAAIRQVKSAFEDTSALALVAANQPLLANVGKLTDRTVAFDTRESAHQDLGLQPAVTFRDRMPAVEAASPLALIELTRDFKAHEDFRVMEFGVHKVSEKAVVERYAEAAIVWTDEKAVQVVIDAEMALARVAVDGTETIFHVGQQGKPKLRVIKTASTADALPGEFVDFSLRFDNIGSQVIGNVTLIDNLTTRLEYMDKTAECSVTAKFFKDENDVDSLTLRWEITEPLKPCEGGLIRFRCRVR